MDRRLMAGGAAAVLVAARAAGVALRVDGGRLQMRPTEAPPSPELLAALRRHRAAVVALIAGEPVALEAEPMAVEPVALEIEPVARMRAGPVALEIEPPGAMEVEPPRPSPAGRGALPRDVVACLGIVRAVEAWAASRRLRGSAQPCPGTWWSDGRARIFAQPADRETLVEIAPAMAADLLADHRARLPRRLAEVLAADLAFAARWPA